MRHTILAFVLTAVTSAGAAYAVDSDAEFVKMAASGGMLEVKTSEMAQRQASSQEVRKFSKHMLVDHTKANNELKQLATGATRVVRPVLTNCGARAGCASSAPRPTAASTAAGSTSSPNCAGSWRIDA